MFDKTTGLITELVDYGKQRIDERFSPLQELDSPNKKEDHSNTHANHDG